VNYAASGELLATQSVSADTTVQGLKALLKDSLEPGKLVQQLLKENYPLAGEKTLEACGLTSGAVLNAVIDSLPVLYMAEPVSCLELCAKYGDWSCVEDCLIDDEHEDRKHADLAGAPALAKEVAMAMKEAAPDLGGYQIVKSSEADEGGEVIVIGHPGPDAKKACLKALGIRKDCEEDDLSIHETEDAGAPDPEIEGVWKLATLESVSWKDYLKVGFNCGKDGLEDPDSVELEEAEKKQLLAITAIMNEKLQKHFVFQWQDGCIVAPVIYGGYTSDDCIVGVLSSRVWT